MRAFIAIEFPKDIQNQLGKLAQNLRSSGLRGVRWVTPENIHLTLKFLGDIKTESVQFLTHHLPIIAKAYSPFTLHLRGLGVFPGLRHPRVLWVGVEAPTPLFDLQRDIEALTQRLGVPPENRPFTPHVTLGRIQADFGPQDQALLETQLQTPISAFHMLLQVNQVALFRSDLFPTGARYTLLFHADFSERDEK
ncbi:MAG: RNA 2',3'-cyclic phosphodiesterase [Thermanaerothrix sp.]|uniref:RNA 2',3'-cyclic phosphodiesterase n=1 Tax=Thermanaerothrix sp. TaxID=2972675 RepID=UPI003C7C91E0